jgi:DNA-binding transcriptional MerR regulator
VATTRPEEEPGILTIGQAASLLHVSEMTLRRWDAAGKFKARRHPMSGYRVYSRPEVLNLLREIEQGVGGQP